MKKENIKRVILFVAALLLGLLAGYLMFGGINHEGLEDKIGSQNYDNQEASVQEQIWTCSMHPQVRQNEPGLCPICEMDLIPLESNTSNDPLVLQMTEEAVKLANIQTSFVGDQQQASNKTIQLSGKIQADERRASSQVAHIPGRIEKLYVSFTGEQVYKGQKLAEVYSPELITAQRELLEAIKLKDVNPGLLDAARNKLSYWKISQDDISSLENNQKVKETFSIYADASGIVTNRRVSIGDYLKTGSVLFDLMNLNKVWVLFDAYEEDLAHVSVGDKVKFRTASLPNKEFVSRINFIDPVVNPKTRAASLRAELSNPSGTLKPEMFVEGILEVGKKKTSQLAIPKSAVMWTGKRSVVYVKLQDSQIPSFQFREIELGESLGDQYLIESGLETGEEIVTHGNFVIDAAAQLNNQASMMNRKVKMKEETEDAIPDYRISTPEKFKNQIHALAHNYIKLKDAFVATDSETASNAAIDFLSKLTEVDMSLIKGESHMFWMDQLNAMKTHGEKIQSSQDVEGQRRQFGFLSDALILTIEAFGSSGEDLYVQYCPMAFDNEGADWISLEEIIQNPYFGDKMMKCGKVKRNLNKPQAYKDMNEKRGNNNSHNH